MRFRVELELNYAKTMSKLSAKLMKAAEKGVGSIQNAWLMIGKEMESDGQIHRGIANSLEEDIVKPLKNLQETHCRIKKTVEYNVTKTSKLYIFINGSNRCCTQISFWYLFEFRNFVFFFFHQNYNYRQLYVSTYFRELKFFTNSLKYRKSRYIIIKKQFL